MLSIVTCLKHEIHNAFSPTVFSHLAIWCLLSEKLEYKCEGNHKLSHVPENFIPVTMGHIRYRIRGWQPFLSVHYPHRGGNWEWLWRQSVVMWALGFSINHPVCTVIRKSHLPLANIIWFGGASLLGAKYNFFGIYKTCVDGIFFGGNLRNRGNVYSKKMRLYLC